jgi:hypothetical protein
MIYQIFTKNHEVPAQKNICHTKIKHKIDEIWALKRSCLFVDLNPCHFKLCKRPEPISSFSHIHSPLLICIACAKNLSSMVTSNSCLDEKGCFHVFFGSIPQAISIWLVSPSAKGRHIHGHLTIARCRIRGRVAVHVAPSPATENRRCSRWMMGVGLEVAVV